VIKVNYSFHKDIPNQYRRAILEETLSKRVSKVPISLCNEIINRVIEEETENETLTNYEVEYFKNGVTKTIEVKGRQKALVECDRILEFGDNKDKSIVIAIRQAKRLVSGYVNGSWMEPHPRDKLFVKSRG